MWFHTDMNADGYLRVRVTAGAKKESIEQTERGFRISVREKAEENRANTRVRELIANELCVPLARVRIVSGHHAPSKMIAVSRGNSKI